MYSVLVVGPPDGGAAPVCECRSGGGGLNGCPGVCGWGEEHVHPLMGNSPHWGPIHELESRQLIIQDLLSVLLSP